MIKKTLKALCLLSALNFLSCFSATHSSAVRQNQFAPKKLCFDNQVSKREQHIFLPTQQEIVQKQKKIVWLSKRSLEIKTRIKKNEAEIEQLKNQLKKGGILIECIAARHRAIRLHPSRNGLLIPRAAAAINIKGLREKVKDFEQSKPILLRLLQIHRSNDTFLRKKMKWVMRQKAVEKKYITTLQTTKNQLKSSGIVNEIAK